MDRPKKAVVINGKVSASSSGNSTLRTFEGGGAIESGCGRLTNQRSWGSGKHQQKQDYKTQERVRAVTLIPY